MFTRQRAVLAIVGLCLTLAGLGALSGRTGGPVTWVVTTGTSMTPEIQPGTFVVLTRQSSYEVGDVVAYRSSQLGQTVLHRVVEVRDDGGLVLKGDANTWLDPVSPAPSDILGARAFAVPGAGRLVRLMQNPLVLGGLVAVIALPFISSSGGKGERATSPRLGSTARRDRRRPLRVVLEERLRERFGHLHDRLLDEPSPVRRLPTSGPTWTDDLPPTPEPRRAVAPPASAPAATTSQRGISTSAGPHGVPAAVETGVACAVVGFLLLGLAASAGPFVERTGSAQLATHTVTWSYDARATPGIVYPDGLATTGDTLYTRLVDAADVDAELRLSGPDDLQVTGSWRLAVSVEDDSGWKQQTSVGRPTEVVGVASSLRVRVPTADLLDLARQASAEAGVESSTRRLTVQALLDLEVEVDGQRQTVAASPGLVFTADDRQIRLADATQLTQTGEVSLPAQQRPSVLTLLGVRLPADTARSTALAGGALSLLLLGLCRRARRDDDEDARITRVAGNLLVPVSDLDEPKHVVEVTSFDALAAVAARYERVVLFGDCDGLRVYLVLDDGVAYRYYDAARAAELDGSRQPPVTAPEPAPSSWAVPQQRSGHHDAALRRS